MLTFNKQPTEKQVGHLKSSLLTGEFWLIVLALAILAYFQSKGIAPQELVERGGKIVIQAKAWVTETLIIILPIYFATKRLVLKIYQMWNIQQKYRIDREAVTQADEQQLEEVIKRLLTQQKKE